MSPDSCLLSLQLGCKPVHDFAFSVRVQYIFEWPNETDALYGVHRVPGACPCVCLGVPGGVFEGISFMYPELTGCRDILSYITYNIGFGVIIHYIEISFFIPGAREPPKEVFFFLFDFTRGRLIATQFQSKVARTRVIDFIGTFAFSTVAARNPCR